MDTAPHGGPTPVPPLVTVHLWRIPATRIPRALLRIAVDRGAVRRAPGVRFAKLMGTGRGTTFAPDDSDLTRWALLVSWADSDAAEEFDADERGVAARWRELAATSGEEYRLDLAPVASHGRWSRREPFGRPTPRRTSGPVAAVTRGRIDPRRALAFWSAAPPVARAVREAPGLRLAIGIGEAPVALQGTLSLWDSHASLRAFAYRDPAHVRMIERTHETGWYAEELFARFAVLASRGTVDGRDPLEGVPR